MTQEQDQLGGHRHACRLGGHGDHAGAERLFAELVPASSPPLGALLRNDRAALAAEAGDRATARAGFRAALDLDPSCEPAAANLALLEADSGADEVTAAKAHPLTSIPSPPSTGARGEEGRPLDPAQSRAQRVAVVSFLFNWPSTGGGNVHTAELVRFLARAGYQVRHFHARYETWGLGTVRDPDFPTEALAFTDSDWTLPAIQDRYRRAVDAFRPDAVVLMDCWNCKPHLATALRGYPTFLRFQALECLCPLNNVRLLAEGSGRVRQCPRQQLASPAACLQCLRERGHQSGALHQAERELAGVGRPGYHEALCRALEEAEAVLVLNPLTEAMLSPYTRRVEVVPWGMDPDRFPARDSETAAKVREPRVKVIFQAGLVEEYMKGFHVLHAACEILWQKRQDFELVATGDPSGRRDAFTRFTGWTSQEDLPSLYRNSDIVAVPTIAQEGLSRTSVEAMASARPVVASRIGGIPYTVLDGETGLLCTPGDSEDLARKLDVLLDDAELRRRMGQEGRRRFEEEYSWPVVIERYYRPLLAPLRMRGTTESQRTQRGSNNA